ncbi:uncharacterized protein MELLADRAFT_108143 [Melampsora larici-populina 98AG31]|uniref:F-box domain-containing protein n=1 Tax=Melampsora larici-populina (strain 98AG31 / pathotype 3-4-7) TaxID=747676 RepID=F4RS39_MELLP|nr:uncharacterized protein MELLADRAFT_108143 [Melampsora larici-populina 98AG31]EGG04842.1 hypothetical protein MELLADRAFT_108143 [Melampsora larici-populina 98AG31]
MAPSPSLPVEIIEKIINGLQDCSASMPGDPTNSGDGRFLTQASIRNLLTLRLISKSWAAIIPKFVYSTLYLRTPWVNHYVKRMWRRDIALSDLSNLRHLSFDQLITLTRFCREAGKQIKLLEYVPTNFAQHPIPILLTLQNQLRGLFIKSIPDELPRYIIEMSFPQLWILRFMPILSPGKGPTWLGKPFFQTIRVFITSYILTRDFWHDLLSGDDASKLAKAVNLRSIVFITPEGSDLIDMDLLSLFAAQGITCLFKGNIYYNEVLSYADSFKSVDSNILERW